MLRKYGTVLRKKRFLDCFVNNNNRNLVSSSVRWQRDCEQEKIVIDLSNNKSQPAPHLCISEKNSGNRNDDKEDSNRYQYPKILYGFSVLSLAGLFTKEDKVQDKIDDKSAEAEINDNKKPGEESDENKSLLERFTVHAAEPYGSNSGDGNAGSSRRAAFNFIADVVKETAPSLVYIEIQDSGNKHFFTGHPITYSNGSGFIVGSDGLILTNAHVVINKPRSSIQVRLHNGEVYVGKVEDLDVKSDLATVRIKCNDLPVMKLGKSKDLVPGEFVVAMGSPLSLSNTITTGVVSNVARPPGELGLEGRDVPEYIQTDAAITFGNSGGPLINLDGEAIGINSMKVTPGISFAIPIDYAKEFLDKSLEAKQVGWPSGKRRYLGITMLSLSSQMIEELKYRGQIHPSVNHGILIYRIVVGSPADRSGLQTGDVITHINNQPVHGSRDVYKILEGKESPLKLRVSRGKQQNIDITVILD